MDIIKKIEGKNCLFLLLVMPVILFTLCTYQGIGMTTDSFNYLYSAKSFSQTGEFKNVDGSYLVHYPPLFPFVLSLLLRNFQLSIQILNLTCLLGTIAIMFKLTLKWFDNFIVAFQYLIVLIFGLPLYLISRFVWSEPLFLLLFSLQLYVLYLYFQKPRLTYIIFLAFISILYCLQRKTGLFLIIGLGMAIGYNTPGEKRVKHTVLYFLLSLLYVPTWLLALNFNASFGQTLNHTPHITRVSVFFLELLGNWIIPPPLPLFIKVSVVALIFLVLTYFFIQQRNRLLLSYFIIFFIYFLTMQIFLYEDFTETERYLSVVYPLFFLIVFKVIDSIYDFPSMIPFKKILTFLVFLWLLYPTVRTLKNINFWYKTSLNHKPIE